MDFLDDFDGPAGAPPSPETWTAELGGGGWGDEQLSDVYARERDGSTGDGCLAITARSDRTSARLTTKGRVTARYGRVEARIKVPAGRGVWPAFWMLGADIDGLRLAGVRRDRRHGGRRERAADGPCDRALPGPCGRR